ncbi:MAG TPA: RNA methyltransferase [Armatimonadota bacterium]|jgi:TrmH family RNA methyltransferase
MQIDSAQNQHVKLFRSLAQSKHRRETGLFALEGRRLIAEAVRARADMLWAAYSPEHFVGPEEDQLLGELMRSGLELHEMGPRALTAMTHTESPPGIVAVAKIPAPPTDLAATLPERAWLLGLWELRDPGNMGTMIRTAHALGGAAVVAVGGCVDFYDPKVVRASAGSLLHLPLVKVHNLYALRDSLAAWQASLVTAAMSAEQACDEADYPARTVLLVGSEAHGLPEEVEVAAQLQVRIPMPGGAESLNAAVAAGIIAFQVARQAMPRD